MKITRRQLKRLIKEEVLLCEASVGRRLDRSTNQISRSAVDAIKNINIREKHSALPEGGQLQLTLEDSKDHHEGDGLVDSELADMENVGRIVLILEVTEGELWTAGAYQYNPENRSNSDLIIALGLPRGYDLSILNFVIPELKEAIRHELEHGTQSTEALQNLEDVSPDGDHFYNMDTLIGYYTQGGEAEAHVAGLYKKAKDMKVSVQLVLDDYLDTIFQRAIDSGMREPDASYSTKKIAEVWYKYLVKRWPESRKFLN